MTQLKSSLGSQQAEQQKEQPNEKKVSKQILENLRNNSPQDASLNKVLFLVSSLWSGDLTPQDTEAAAGLFDGEVDMHYAIRFLLQALQGISTGCSPDGPITSGMIKFVESSGDPDKFKRELPIVLSHLTRIAIIGEPENAKNK